MDKISIMIVDRLAFFRLGLREILTRQADFELTDCGPDEDILKIIDAKAPDVLLLDINFPSLSGLDLGRKVVQRYAGTRVVILSSNPNDEQLFEVAKTGALAYLDKNTDSEEFVRTIRRAYRGEYPINESLIATPRVAERVLKQFQTAVWTQKTMEAIVARLTPREAQILNHIASGNSNKKIAQVLGISEQTIKNHVSAILRKLNANDRAHAVVLAIRQGLISLEEKVPVPTNSRT
jgi:two-component system response regulator DegU